LKDKIKVLFTAMVMNASCICVFLDN